MCRAIGRRLQQVVGGRLAAALLWPIYNPDWLSEKPDSCFRRRLPSPERLARRRWLRPRPAMVQEVWLVH